MNREKTDSITHLVKIVAEEVVKDKNEHTYQSIQNLSHRVCAMERRYQDRKYNNAIMQYIDGIRSSTRLAGQKWSLQEDNTLVAEIDTAIAQIAQNHDRTKGSVICRIREKELLGRQK